MHATHLPKLFLQVKSKESPENQIALYRYQLNTSCYGHQLNTPCHRHQLNTLCHRHQLNTRCHRCQLNTPCHRHQLNTLCQMAAKYPVSQTPARYPVSQTPAKYRCQLNTPCHRHQLDTLCHRHQLNTLCHRHQLSIPCCIHQLNSPCYWNSPFPLTQNTKKNGSQLTWHIVWKMSHANGQPGRKLVWGEGINSSVVRAPGSWLKGCEFESLREQGENFFSVLTFISVFVPPPFKTRWGKHYQLKSLWPPFSSFLPILSEEHWAACGRFCISNNGAGTIHGRL